MLVFRGVRHSNDVSFLGMFVGVHIFSQVFGCIRDWIINHRHWSLTLPSSQNRLGGITLLKLIVNIQIVLVHGILSSAPTCLTFFLQFECLHQHRIWWIAGIDHIKIPNIQLYQAYLTNFLIFWGSKTVAWWFSKRANPSWKHEL